MDNMVKELDLIINIRIQIVTIQVIIVDQVIIVLVIRLVTQITHQEVIMVFGMLVKNKILTNSLFFFPPRLL